MAVDFTHLHVHTQYSLMEGAIRIKALAKKLKEMEFSACAITDHGNMFGAVEFYSTFKKQDLKAIIGLGAYISETPLDAPQESGHNNTSLPYQTNLLCLDKGGYKNLIKLASIAFTEGKQHNIPRLDHRLLEQYHEGLIATSSGLDGELGRRLSNGHALEARKIAQWYRDLFHGRYYIELQNTGLPNQHEVNQQLIKLAKELGIPLIATNDCHYLTREEGEAHYILELMRMQKRVSDSDIPPMLPPLRYLKSYEEMKRDMEGFPPEALSNTNMIAELCDLSLDNKTYYLPQFEVPQGHDLSSWLTHEAKEGLNKRLEHIMELLQPDQPLEEFRKPYDERLEVELEIIIKMGFPGYFLIVADFINWAKDHGIPVGPGRGSGAGSLVAYAIRITDVNPLQYGLLFERFLNPDRVSMPDFDIDFEVQGRDAVIQYVREHYGERNVCQIATFQTLGAKAALRNVARVLNFPYSEADKIAKLIPNKLGISLQESIDQEPELAKLESDGNDNEKKLITHAKTLEGLSTHLGTHAAGVIIMDSDIREVMPICTGKEDSVQSMYTMKYAEDQGAVKFDFLGLLNLSIIDGALKIINSMRPPEEVFDINKIPMFDQLTFDLFCKGDTTGVFQLESSGMKKLLMDMKPSVFEDIVAILALYRPGPLGSGMVDDFIQCKHGKKPVKYPHPLLEEVLKETYGVMVYQEQIMKAVQVLANFTLGQADLLRRAIGKKIKEVLETQRANFVQGCLANPRFMAGCGTTDPTQVANNIFDLIDYFSGYGFNKSHTVAYGVISYQTAYLKANFPVQFMAALLNCSMNNPDKVVNFISEARDMGIQVLPPDVNQSIREFTVSPNGFQVDRRVQVWVKEMGVPDMAIRSLKRLQKRVYETEAELEAAIRGLDQAEALVPFLDLIKKKSVHYAVRFGLNAVKNVGGSAVEFILEARRKKPNNQFSDLLDFMKSIDHRKVNKRILETLVKCGAFDSIEPNRRRLLEGLDDAIHLGEQFQEAETPGQDSLFALLDATEVASTESQLKLPDLPDWPKKKRLEYEKESLGFYVSGHPLDRYASEVERFTQSTIDLQEGKFKEGDEISLAGVIISKTIRLNKNSEKFAIVKIEDLRGSVEFPVFTKVYNEVKEILEEDEPILVSGTVSVREEEMGIRVNELKQLKTVRESQCKGLAIHLQGDQLKQDALKKLKGAFVKHPGPLKVHLHLLTETQQKVKISIPNQIQVTQHLVEELDNMLPGNSLKYRY